MERKKVVFLPLSLLLLFIASCAVQPDVPLVAAEAGPATTTTSTTVPLPPLVIVQAPPATTTTTTTTTTTIAPKPTITEPAFRNLFGIVNLCDQEIQSYEIDAVLPGKTPAIRERFQDAKAYYEVEIRRLPFNGTSAYPVAAMLSGAETDLKALLEEGLPLRSEAEMKKASAAAEYARSRDSSIGAADRFENAEAELAFANDFHASKEYRTSIASYKRASLLYESAAMKAGAETLFAKVAESGYGRYSPFHAAEAERLRAEDADLYDAGSNDSIREGTEKLKTVARDCGHILAWGAERRASETRAQATAAKQADDIVSAEINAREEYSLAAMLMADGDQKRGYGDFADAATDYVASTFAFTEAHKLAAEAKFSAGVALELAKAALDGQKAKIDAAGCDEDLSFQAARELLKTAGDKFLAAMFVCSKLDSSEALNQLRISDAALRTLAEARLAAEKAEADRAAVIALEANKQAAESAASLALREAEIGRLNAEKAEAERQLAATKSLLTETQLHLAGTEGRLAATELQLAEIEDRLAETERRLMETESHLAGTKDRLAELESRSTDTRDRLAETDDRLVKAEGQLAETKGRLMETESLLADTERQLKETKNSLDDTERRLMEAKRLAAERLSVEIGIVKKAILLSLDLKAFSPNGDGIKDVLNIRTHVPATPVIKQYEVAIYALDASGSRYPTPVKTWEGSTHTSAMYTWDGGTDSGGLAPDGAYQAALNILFSDGEEHSPASPAIALNATGPRISVQASPLLFSPNGDGNKDMVAITQDSSIGDDWTGLIRSASGAIVRSWSWKSEAKSFSWDGRDSSGSFVRDGVYSYEVEATDMAGNTSSAIIPAITVDGTIPKVYVSASDTGMSPNGDGIRDELSFAIVVERREGIESWRFSLIDAQGVERNFFDGTGSELPARLVWDGRDLRGQTVRGQFMAKLAVSYAKGDVAQAFSAPILVDAAPPAATIAVDPKRFSPDGDGVDDKLHFGISADAAAGIVEWKLDVFEAAPVESSAPGGARAERLFAEWSGKGKPPATIAWDGKSARGELVESATDYPFKLLVRDALGNSVSISGVIAVDVLVMREGGRLKIKVPSIVFRANYADFVDLSPDIVARNEEVVTRVAQILNKFPDYRIRIEGHANSAAKIMGLSQAKIDSEETSELIPLSTGRAELVRAMLVRNGVEAKRLSVAGLGSSAPVVEFHDAENRWKNRRVEFVLIKNK
ncbi:MAG TPA: FlgD immunoglobulin-like domain containing protein [Rectinemataceae bacterium]|nr:FlgD immunoglobulin-like domain containing protein [Rectinemataceae bacterium]